MGLRARGFDKHSRATRVWVFCPTGSTTCPARLTPTSKAPGGLRAVLSISGQCPRARGVDQLSLATQARVRGPKGSTSSPGPGRLVSGCDSLRFRQALPGDSDQCPSARDVDQLSWATHVRVRSPVRSTRCPAQPGLWSEVRRGPPAPRATRARVRGSAGLTSSPGQSGLGPMACRVDQLSWRTRAKLRWPAGSTTCLVGPGAVFQCLRCRTALPGDSGPCPMARDVDQCT